MAATQTEAPVAAPRARRKPQGPRVNKPIFAVVRYTDEQGNRVKLDKSNLTIELARDAALLVDLMESGEAQVFRVELPVAAKPAAASGSASA